MNLLSNAVKFTNDGGNVHVTAELIETDGKTVTVATTVADDGIGISPEDQSKLFTSFTQADSGISRRFGGTGLGLAIARNIAELQGGGITVQSELGKGSAFTVTITQEIAPQKEEILSQDTKVYETVDFSGKTILIAEDVEINQVIIESILEDTGVKINFANNGIIAVEMAAKTDYDLIFMDIHMPEMDGYEATRQIRAAGSEVPIIAMTANVFREDVERCLEAGMDAHTGKPIERNAVLEIMKEYLL